MELVLIHPGDKKVNCIKAVRNITGLGLKEAVELVDNSPNAVLLTDLDKETGYEYVNELTEAGACVRLGAEYVVGPVEHEVYNPTEEPDPEPSNAMRPDEESFSAPEPYPTPAKPRRKWWPFG